MRPFNSNVQLGRDAELKIIESQSKFNNNFDKKFSIRANNAYASMPGL